MNIHEHRAEAILRGYGGPAPDGPAFLSSSKPDLNGPDHLRAVAPGPSDAGRMPRQFLDGDRVGVAFPDGTPTYDGVGGAHAAGMDRLTSGGDHRAQENEAKRGRAKSFAERAVAEGGRVNHAGALVADRHGGAGAKIKATKSAGFTAPDGALAATAPCSDP